MKIYPAILTESTFELSEQLAVVQDQPKVEVVHLDIIDGFFADNLTVTPIDLAEVNISDLQLDLHLMVTEPLDFVFETISAVDKEQVRSIIGQIEQMSWQTEFLEEVKKHGWRGGLALDLFTPVEELDENIWHHLDIIQLMAIEAGEQGKSFNELVFSKIDEVKELAKKHDKSIEIVIDGGIKKTHLAKLSRAGVEGVAIGSDIWTATDPQAELSELLQLAEKR